MPRNGSQTPQVARTRDEMPKLYKLVITIPGLPPTYNAIGRKSRWVLMDNARKWKDNVRFAVGRFLPSKPLEKARVEIIRCSTTQGDYDGLVQAAKPLLDGLVEAGVLADDSMKVIGVPTYGWEKAEKKKGCVKICVEEWVMNDCINDSERAIA